MMTEGWQEPAEVQKQDDAAASTAINVDERVDAADSIDTIDAGQSIDVFGTNDSRDSLGPVDSVDVLAIGVSDDSAPSQGALPLDVRTGDARVDAAVAALRELDGRPVEEHAEVFTQVHRDLQDALLTLDQD